MKHKYTFLAAVVLLVLASTPALAVTPIDIACLPNTPVVDGDIEGEYEDATFVGVLHIAGNPDMPELGELYLGYTNEALYGYLVGYHPIATGDRPDEYWVKLSGVTYELTKAFGSDYLMEFSASPVEQGQYNFTFHTNFLYEGKRQTGALSTEISISCATGIWITMGGKATGFTDYHRAVVKWRVVWQAGLTIFTVQRADSQHGEYEDIATVRGGPLPAKYRIIDRPLQDGFPYWYRINANVLNFGEESIQFPVEWR